MQIITENLSYTYPSGTNVLHDIGFSLQYGETAALTGDNGSGKSTLLRILAGDLHLDTGALHVAEHKWFVPQHFGQYNHKTIAEVLQIGDKLHALHAIEKGSVNSLHFEILSDDWAVYDRLHTALAQWNLPKHSPDTPFSSLSGGQKTRVFLAGMALHRPKLVLMDEPTNHLDTAGRKRLYQTIREPGCDFLIVSHDRKLLNLCNPIYELSSLGIKKYGGNYDFYEEQKQIETEAIGNQVHHAKQTISEARKKSRETMQRKQKLDARGNKKARTENFSKIIINAARNSAESSTSKLKADHEQKIAEEQQQLQQLKRKQREFGNIRINLNDSDVHSGKILFKADRINFTWPDTGLLWKKPLSFTIQSGERIRITGPNGSGKSTLIRLLNGSLQPGSGNLEIQSEHRFLLDQEYGFIDREATVLEQAESVNQINKADHKLKTLLHRHLFEEKVWNQKCSSLSGGEMMRLSLCCLALQAEQPDTIILDEPTNNLDLRNLQILAEAVSGYLGTLLVVSHDGRFIEDVGIERSITLSRT